MAKKKAAEIAAENEGKRGAVKDALANHEGGLTVAAEWGAVLPNITSLVQFREKVKEECVRLNLDRNNTEDVHKAGAIIIQETTVRMLEEY